MTLPVHGHAGARTIASAAQPGGLAASVAAVEWAAWLLLVPSTMTVSTFVLLNGLAVAMFLVGFASAAKGLPTCSVSLLLAEVERGPRGRG